MEQIRSFIKNKRKELKLTQADLAIRAGVGIRVIREIEQGRETLKANTLNKILRLFGKTIGPVDL